MHQGAPEAVRPNTDPPVESEEHMGGADQPVLVHRIELDGFSELQNLGPSHEGNVVVVNDIKTFLQNLPDTGRLKKRKAGLVCGQGG